MSSAPTPDHPPPPGFAKGTVNVNHKYMIVEYPGRVRNRDEALQTLGGEDEISRCMENESDLELRFRPNEPLSRPIYGDNNDAHSLILRVRRRKSAPQDMRFEVIGLARNKYTFDRMADFQLIPPDEINILAPMSDLANGFDLSIVQAMHVPVYRFGSFDRPQEYNFRQSMAGLNVKKTTAAKQTSQKVQHIFFNFNAETPTKPLVDLPRLVSEDEVKKLAELEHLFETRAVWSKLALSHSAPNLREQLKQLLPYVAYNMKGGPWRMMWIKYGYDPRKQPDAKPLQVLDVRLPVNLFKTYQNLHTDKNETTEGSKKSAAGVNKKGKKEAKLTALTTTTQRAHILSKDSLPFQKQTIYQLCDLHDVELQNLINRGTATECTVKDGWCLPGTMEALRKELSKIMKSALSDDDAHNKDAPESLTTLMKGSDALPAIQNVSALIERTLGGDGDDDDDDDDIFGSSSDEEEEEEEEDDDDDEDE